MATLQDLINSVNTLQDSVTVLTEEVNFKKADLVQAVLESEQSETQAGQSVTLAQQAVTDAEALVVLAQQAVTDTQALVVIATTKASDSATSASEANLDRIAAEEAKDIVLANIIDPATQIEVSGNVTALEAWRNKVIIVTNDSTITIPSVLFTEDWTFRAIVRNGFLQIEKLGSKTFPFGNPEPLINPKSDFTIRQRGLTQEVLITGNIISTPFEASFQTQNVLAGGSNDFQVKLPFSSTSFEPVIVDWGDGIVESIASFDADNTTKTYLVKGEYRIKIYGNIFYIPFANGLERLKIGEVFYWGNLVIGFESFFFCDNLTADRVVDIPVNINDDLGRSFSKCLLLTRINRLNKWPTQNVTNIAVMFDGNPLFNQDISFNTSNVTSAAFLLRNCILFNGSLLINTSNAASLQQMLRGAINFNRILAHLNVSASTNFVDFMRDKTFLDYSAENYDGILNGWTERSFAATGLTFGFGTIRRSAAGTEGRALMTRPSATVNITNAINNGSGLIRITAEVHGLTTLNKVFIAGVLGTIGANKGWVVTVIDADTIDLQGSLFANNYISGGTVRTGWGHTIIDGGI